MSIANPNILLVLGLALPLTWYIGWPRYAFRRRRDISSLVIRSLLLLLVILAMGCTLLPFAISLAALRHVSAFSTTIALNMEPVYAIVLAIVLLGEQRELSPSFYLGVAIVLGAVFLHPWVVPQPAKPTPLNGAVAADPRDRDKSGSV